MKEATYNSTLASKIEKEIGGKVYKISDQSTLGMPDSVHLLDGIATFIECKIGKTKTSDYVEPLESINDLRQFEVCRRISLNSLVLYAIYYPEIKSTAVIPVRVLHAMKSSAYKMAFIGQHLTRGHGIDLVAKYMKENREHVTDQLNRLRGKGQGVC